MSRLFFLSLLLANQVYANEPVEVGSNLPVSEGKVVVSATYDAEMSIGNDIRFTDAEGKSLLFEPTEESKKSFAIAQIRCKSKQCLVEGQLELRYAFGTPEVVFIFDQIRDSDETKGQTFQQSMGAVLKSTFQMSGYAVFGESPERFVLKANPNRLSSSRVKVDLTQMKDEQLISFIENCFEQCDRVVVKGSLSPDITGDFILVAESVVKE